MKNDETPEDDGYGDLLAHRMWQIATSDLTARQMRVAMIIALRYYDVPEKYSPAIPPFVIAEHTGIRQDVVRRIMEELWELGYIELYDPPPPARPGEPRRPIMDVRRRRRKKPRPT